MGDAWQAAYVLGAYLLGSISFAAILVRTRTGIDLRTVGSGNLGATNAGRVLGRRWAIGIYGLDLLKGGVPAGVARHLLQDPGAFGTRLSLALAAGAAAFLGHCWPIWHGLRGGKGVATASGVLLVLSPAAFGASLAVFLIAYGTSRMVSLGSILAALSLPLLHRLFESGRHASEAARIEFWTLVLLAAVVIFRHRANLRRILAGTEPRRGKHGP
jgi:glycerol-3-phosphate acyltransferase PlsY